jgi:hypothetical protein
VTAGEPPTIQPKAGTKTDAEPGVLIQRVPTPI